MADKTYTVKSGDTIESISDDFEVSVNYLCKINGIHRHDRLRVGQRILISERVSNKKNDKKDPWGKNNNTQSARTATVTEFGLQSGTERSIVATWTWSKENTEKYSVKWSYDTGNGLWYVGSESDTNDTQSVYNAPSYAERVKFQVKPISKTYRQNRKTTSYWTADWSTESIYIFGGSESSPSDIDPPTVTLKEYTLTATVNVSRINGDEVQFQIIQNDYSVFKTGNSSMTSSSVSYSCTIAAGSNYKVRCRVKKNNAYGEWSEYSPNAQTKPNASSGITSCVATSATSIKVTWTASINGSSVTNDSTVVKPTNRPSSIQPRIIEGDDYTEDTTSKTTYELQHTTKLEYFEGSNAITSITNIETTTYEITGLESGQTYFFRVRAVNDEGESEWSGVYSAIIGTIPGPPTTWSSTTTAIVNDAVKLYWVHNSEDNSMQKVAELELIINGTTITHTIDNPDFSDENFYYTLNTSSYADSTSVLWRVRTKGAVDEWGEWSIQRTINIYSPPSLSLNVADADKYALYTLESFPFYIIGVATPTTQTPVGYQVTIVADEAYECLDEVGNVKMISKGEEVYSQYYNINDDLVIKMTPSDIDLENNVSYTVHCVVTMNTGLSAEEQISFNVRWTETFYTPDVELAYDPETLCMHLRPYCVMYPMIFYEVEYQQSKGEFHRTNKIVEEVSGTSIPDVFTEEYEDIVYYGTKEDGSTLFFCTTVSDTPMLIEGVTLAVYRREYDGRFIEIANNLSNVDNSFITDPHPALDYARYRIVAIDDSTGAISYTDIPGYPIEEKAVIIQWNEAWSSFNSSIDEQLEKPAWSGSMLRLPYNIDISDSNSADVAMVEYIGRSHPVSYYGTQLGVQSTWNMEIDKSDKDTLYALRRLAIYMGDVYVREPSGSGYWAHVSVSFSQTHCELTIPVTIEVTRVEGGI